MPLYEAVPGLVAVALLGWLAGMMTFKRSLRWCAVCGRRLSCAACTRVSDYQPSRIWM
jgi:hypothetical protein